MAPIAALALALMPAAQDAADGLDELLGRLAAHEPAVRVAAAQELGETLPAPGRVVPALIARLDDEDEDVIEAAARAVAKYGEPAIEPLVAAVEDPATLSGAIEALLWMWRGSGKTREPVKGSLASLGERDDLQPTIDYEIAGWSLRTGYYAPGDMSLDGLLRVLGHTSRRGDLLARMRGKLDLTLERGDELPALLAEHVPDPSLRTALHVSLTMTADSTWREMWPPSFGRAPAVLEPVDVVPLLLHEATDIRATGTWALGVSGSRTHVGAIELLSLLEDPEPEVRMLVAWALGRRAELDSDWPFIIQVESQPWLYIGGGAGGRFGGRRSEPTWEQRIQSRLREWRAASNRWRMPSELQRAQTTDAAPSLVAAVPRLGDLLNDPEEKVQRAALWALARAGEVAHPVAPQVRARLRDGTPYGGARVELLVALVAIEGVEDAAESLCAVLDDPAIAGEAERWLGAMRPPPVCAFEHFSARFLAGHKESAGVLIRYGEASVPVFMEALYRTSQGTRGPAILALGRLGPSAIEAIPRLEEIAAGEDPYLGAAAKGALKRIRR